MRIQIIVKVPYTTNNARQILDKDYLMYNVCHGTPGAELQGVIPPDKDGDTSYMKLQGVQTDPRCQRHQPHPQEPHRVLPGVASAGHLR